MSDKCPAGVRYFGHAKSGSKGKHHPADLGSGPNTTEFISGGGPAPKLAKGGSSKLAGVKQLSGTEHFTKVQHKNASLGGPAKKAGANATPDGVRSFGGGKAKRG